MTVTVDRGRRVLAIVLVLINLPVALALVEAVSFKVYNRENGTLVSSGEKRVYLLYVPPSYDPTRPAPLVISMHGAALWPTVQKDISGWNKVADENGFLVVYPAGLQHGLYVWRVEQGPGLAIDVRFSADLIDKLRATYNIDPSRIYADGLSNGGGMAFALSCTMPDRIAAVGMVGPALTLPWNGCPDPRPVPVIAFHGTADPAAPYNGGSSWVTRSEFPSIPVWMTHWAQRNGCAPSPSVSRVAPDVTRRTYTHCTDNAAVVFYTIQGGGHTWPGGRPLPEWFVGPTSRSIDASREMWAFFREHPLRRNE